MTIDICKIEEELLIEERVNFLSDNCNVYQKWSMKIDKDKVLDFITYNNFDFNEFVNQTHFRFRITD